MDPLRPFASLVDALWRSRTIKSKTDAASAQPRRSADADFAEAAASAQARESLELRLRNRLKQTGLANPAIARSIFVETVLSWEIGEHVVHTPGFEEITLQVSQHIGSDSQLSERLHFLLQDLVS